MYRVAQSTLVVTGALLLAACGASDFAPPVTAFSKVTTDAATSFKSSRESVEKFANERRLKIAADGGSITPAPKECTPDAPRCRLLVTDKKGKATPLNLSLDNLQALMDGLDDYTKSLSDIVKADTASAVAKGTEAIKANLTSLAQNGEKFGAQLGVRDVNFARVTPFIAPVADATNYVIGKVLEAQKIAVLRQSTAEMEEMFPSLTKVFNAVNTAALRLQKNQIDAAFTKAFDDYRHNRSDSNRDNYIRAAAAYDAILNGNSNPKNVFDTLREAHGVLAQALKAPNPSFSELWALLEKATEEANKLAEINKSFQTARETASKS